MHAAPSLAPQPTVPPDLRLGDRRLFPRLREGVYFNHAGVSPASSLVEAAVSELVVGYAREGIGAIGAWIGQRERIRAGLARLVGGSAAEIALTEGTTAGVRDIAFSLPWQRGDRVVLFEGEFPANVTPWEQAARTFDLELVRLPLHGFVDGSGLSDVEQAIGGGARLIAVSAVQFSTGLRMPLEELAGLAHAAGAELFVDGIQALGVVPLDAPALGIDYLVAGAHKWLMGLEGCGFAWVAPGREASLVPRMAGWLSHEDPVDFLFKGAGHLRSDRPIRRRADMLEGGARNAVGFAALEAGLAPIEALSVPAVFEHVSGLLDTLEAGLVGRGWVSLRSPGAAGRSGILSVLPPRGEDVLRWKAGLEAAGISVALPDGRLRFSPHWMNSAEQVDEVIAVVDRLSA